MAKADVELKEVQNKSIPEQGEAVETPTRNIKKTIDKNEEIACRSIHDGLVIYENVRTGFSVVWNGINDVQYLPYGELIMMRSAQPRFLDEPWIEPEEDAIEALGLTAKYANVLKPHEITQLFYKHPNELEAYLKIAPKGVRNTIAQQARILYERDQLWDMRIIRILEKELNVDLSIVKD